MNLAIVDYGQRKAWTMRYMEPTPFSSAVVLDSGPNGLRRSVRALDITIRCGPSDAVLLAAPFIKYRRSLWARLFGRFDGTGITVAVDGFKVMEDSPARAHLRTAPDRLPGAPVFRRVGDVHAAAGFTPQWEADMGRMTGVFAVNGACVTMDITGIPPGRVEMVAGIVAVRYTTRWAQYRGGPKDWSPRMAGRRIGMAEGGA